MHRFRDSVNAVRWLMFCAVIALTAMCPRALYAAESCIDAKSPWSCFGELEIQQEVPAPATLRVTRYLNDEQLIESERNGISQKIINAQPSGLVFMTGSNWQSTVAFNALMTSGMQVDMIVRALQEALPDGPKSIGEAPIENRAARLVGESVRVTLRRLSLTKVAFEITSSVAPARSIHGYVVQPLTTPLPGTMSLDGWCAENTTAATLAAARNLPPRPKATNSVTSGNREYLPPTQGKDAGSSPRKDQDEALEKFASSIAQAMVDKRQDYIFDRFHSRVRAIMDAAIFQRTLQEIHDRYGDVLAYKLRQRTVGFIAGVGEPIRIVTYLYEVQTSSASENRFLKIEVGKDGPEYRVASVALLEFLGGDIPPWMR